MKWEALWQWVVVTLLRRLGTGRGWGTQQLDLSAFFRPRRSGSAERTDGPRIRRMNQEKKVAGLTWPSLLDGLSCIARLEFTGRSRKVAGKGTRRT